MPTLTPLEPREPPAVDATLAGFTLVVTADGPGDHAVSIDRVADRLVVTGDGAAFDFDAAAVTGLYARGAPDGRNVLQNNTALAGTLVGGNRADTLFGGTGVNVIDPGPGRDVVYALLGANTVITRGQGADRVFVNFAAVALAGDEDLLVRFFAPHRTPGTPNVTVEQGVLYVTPTNNGSSFVLTPAFGGVRATFDLGDGLGPQSRVFAGVRAVAYFGGAGDDLYVNQTGLVDVAYGSAGDDRLFGGRGDYSLLKGSGGRDTLVGRARNNDLSGNAGGDFLLVLTPGRRDVFRIDSLDAVLGADAPDVVITP